MKLYIVRSDDCVEYDAMVIRADSPEEAERIVREDYYRRNDLHNNPGDYHTRGASRPYGNASFPGFEPHRAVKVEELDHEGTPGIILACFHEG